MEEKMNVEKKDFLYEGKAKQIYSTDDPNLVIIHYKDDATAGNGAKKGTIANKGKLNNEITSILFEMLEKNGVKTHFKGKLNERDQVCEKLHIFPLEVIVRNVIAGSMAKRVGIPEGTKPVNTIFEICYKNDKYGDPLINDHHAVALGLASYEELEEIYAITAKINELLKTTFDKEGITLVDFKIEFGKNSKGEIMLADEITPDTCRLWDKETGEKLDKDRFRRDLGSVEEAYIEILKRLGA
jgi:phosphoribosylaminoimidazole-succinocarboxamide synthase